VPPETVTTNVGSYVFFPFNQAIDQLISPNLAISNLKLQESKSETIEERIILKGTSKEYCGM